MSVEVCVAGYTLCGLVSFLILTVSIRKRLEPGVAVYANTGTLFFVLIACLVLGFLAALAFWLDWSRQSFSDFLQQNIW